MNPYYIFYEEVMMKVRMSLFKAFLHQMFNRNT